MGYPVAYRKASRGFQSQTPYPANDNVRLLPRPRAANDNRPPRPKATIGVNRIARPDLLRTLGRAAFRGIVPSFPGLLIGVGADLAVWYIGQSEIVAHFTGNHPTSTNPIVYGAYWTTRWCGSSEDRFKVLNSHALGDLYPDNSGYPNILKCLGFQLTDGVFTPDTSFQFAISGNATLQLGQSQAGGARQIFEKTHAFVRFAGAPVNRTITYHPLVPARAPLMAPLEAFNVWAVPSPAIAPAEMPIGAWLPAYRPIPYRALPHRLPLLPGSREQSEWGPRPEPRTVVDGAPGVVIGNNTVTNSPPTAGNPRPPPRGTRQRKAMLLGKTGVGRIVRVARRGVSRATEALDWTNAIWWALPETARTPWAKPHQKLADIYNHAGEINISRMVWNLIRMELTDRAWATIGQQGGVHARRLGMTFGPQTGQWRVREIQDDANVQWSERE